MSFFLGFCTMFCMFLVMLFFILGNHSLSDDYTSSSFECGFSSYYFSRFSFSVHYFLVGLIFLFLDLELGVLFLFLSFDYLSFGVSINMLIFLFSLLGGLYYEIFSGNVEWFD